MLEGSYQLGLSDLLDQNLSSYEYFYGLPKSVQKKISQRDVASASGLFEGGDWPRARTPAGSGRIRRAFAVPGGIGLFL